MFEATSRPGIGSKRSRLHLSTGLSGAMFALLVMAPVAAHADGECGVLKPNVHCAAAGNPYQSGITYRLPAEHKPQDLTVHLDDGVDVDATGLGVGGVTVSNSGGSVRVSGAGAAVHTSGEFANGVTATSLGGDAGVSIGQVRTTGDRALGVLAISQYGDASVQAAQVATEGYASNGIQVLARNGAASVTAGSVATRGDLAAGVYAAGQSVDVNTTGAVSTRGVLSYGVDAVAGAGGADIRAAGPITTSGYGASAINVVSAGGVSVEASGPVTTRGDFANGVLAITQSGAPAAAIDIDAGTVRTSGYAGNGVLALNQTDGGSVRVAAGQVRTTGAYSLGVYARGQGDTTVTAGRVITTGDHSFGVEAIGSGAVAVDVRNVQTSGDFSSGVSAVNLDPGGVTSVHAGTVTVGGANDFGVYVGAYGASTIDVGKVSTSGANAIGILAFGDGPMSVTANSVTTTGGYSEALAINDTQGDVTLDIGAITTTGAPHLGSASIGAQVAASNGDVKMTVGSVSTSGDHATGLLFSLFQGSLDLNIKQGVTTTGAFSRGVYAFAQDGDVTIRNQGQITTSGPDSGGIRASTDDGDIKIVSNGMTTAGDGSAGIETSAQGGDADIHATSISTAGYGSNGITAVASQGYSLDGVLHGGDVAVNADTVHTTGGASTAIYAASMTGAVTVSGSHISTTGAGSYGLFAKSIYGPVTVTGGDISTLGANAPAVVAYSAYDTAKVSLGTVSTVGDHSVGVFVGGGKGSSLTVDSVKTAGYGSTGVSVVAGSQLSYGAASATIGSVETDGDASIGIAMASGGGGSTLNVGSVVTHGYYSTGINIGAQVSDTVLNVGSITTTGNKANAIYGAGYGGALKLTAGNLSTQGDQSAGMRTESLGGASILTVTGSITTSGYFSQGIFSTSVLGDTVIDNQGTITTTGGYSDGIIANIDNGHAVISGGSISTSGDMSTGIRVFAVGDDAKDITITADSIVTTGANADGITAENPDDGVIGFSVPAAIAGGAHAAGAQAPDAQPGEPVDISITTNLVKVTGAYSNGIEATGVGNVTVDTGTTYANSGRAMLVTARDLATITVRQAATSNTSDAILETGADAILNVQSGAVVSGGANGVVLDGAGPYVPPPEGYYGPVFAAAALSSGTVTVNNAGAISGGSGYAIVVEQGAAVINNAGRIDGAVAFSGNDDVLNNSGVFNATKDSDFGGGDDLFSNTGVLNVLPGTASARSVSFLGLERFVNAGGLVDLRNGHTGDVLTLAGAYEGSGDARLGLDIGGGAADVLIVGGAAQGRTTILLNGIDPATATLTSRPINLVKAGAGSSAGAFALANPDVGLIRYGLAFDAATDTYGLVGTAGLSVYRAMKIENGAEGVWRKSAEAWSSHLADMRDLPAETSGRGGRVWGQLIGSSDHQEDHRLVTDGGGDAQSYDLTYNQSYYGAQAGADLVRSSAGGTRILLGVMGGYITSNQYFADSIQQAQFKSFDLGAYASLAHGPLFADALVQYGHHDIEAKDRSLAYDVDFGGRSLGVQGEVGARLGTPALSLEPIASLQWVHTSLDDLTVLGQTLDYDRADGLRGKAGARMASSSALGDGATLVAYASGALVHEFGGKDGLDFLSGDAVQHIDNDRTPTYAQTLIGLSFTSRFGVTTWLEGGGDFGSDYKSATGRVGVSLRF